MFLNKELIVPKLCNFLNIKLYNEWLKASDIFVKPRLKWKFGFWTKDPCLPCWRSKPIIRLYSIKDKDTKVYYPNNSVMYRKYKKGDIDEKGKICKYDTFDFHYHKLPKGIRYNKLIWNSRIRKKLKKYHLGWLPTCITLPRIFSFHIFNYDLFVKEKESGNISFEFPPQLTIVLFGLSLSFWLREPEAILTNNSKNASVSYERVYDEDEDINSFLIYIPPCVEKEYGDYHYWEMMENYLYLFKNRDIKEYFDYLQKEKWHLNYNEDKYKVSVIYSLFIEEYFKNI